MYNSVGVQAFPFLGFEIAVLIFVLSMLETYVLTVSFDYFKKDGRYI